MIILGISCFYHDSAACIIKDGKIFAAAAEERFSRIKHDNEFPKEAINFCLDSINIAANEVDIVTFYEKPLIKLERIFHQYLQHFPNNRKLFMNTAGDLLKRKINIRQLLAKEMNYFGRVVFIPHHTSHAASAYYLSGFDESSIVTIDGVGEWATTTIGYAKKKKIVVEKEIRFPHSLGLLYSTITTFLGFKANNDEYKVMGLAAFGDPKKFMSKVDKLIKTYDDGSYALDMKYFDFTWSNHMPSKKMKRLFGYAPRKPEGKLHKYHKDIAASLQLKIEQVTFHLLNKVHERYKTNNLCLAGGVALNSVMNGKIVKNTPFKKVFIPPDPGDGGGAMGAALFTHYKRSNKDIEKSFTPYLGPNYTWYEIEKVLEKYDLKYAYYQDKSKLLAKVSDILVKQKVIGWFQGKMEWGPRALGNRSILASAEKEEMKDIINSKVKKREMFRPFAPVVLKKYASLYFETNQQPISLGKYMLIVLPFKERGKKEAPATVHVNGSGRPQIIERKNNPLYYDLINNYMKKANSPILINTSLNTGGKPIVCSPEDAVKCYLESNLDALVIEKYLIKKDNK